MLLCIHLKNEMKNSLPKFNHFTKFCFKYVLMIQIYFPKCKLYIEKQNTNVTNTSNGRLLLSYCGVSNTNSK